MIQAAARSVFDRKCRRAVVAAGVMAGVMAWVAASVLVAASPADAGATAEIGALWIHGAGSVFAGPNSYESVPTTPSGTATYTIEVVNEGPVTAQFNVRMPSTGSLATATLAAGSLLTTPLAAGPHGYYTSPIAPGKSEVLTLRVKTPASATQTDKYLNEVDLYDTSADFLNRVQTYTTIKSTTGSATADTYTTTPGGGYVRAAPGEDFSVTTAQAIKGTAKAAFTVKVQNDGTGPASPLNNGSYTTPVLAHGRNVTIAVSVGAPASVSATCGWDVLQVSTVGGGQSTDSEMIVNTAAVLP